MEYVLLALVLIPVLVCPLFMLLPSQYPQLTRYVAALTGGVLFGLSLLVFVVYQFDGGAGLRYELQWDWLENVGFLGENGITFYLGVDGIGAPLVLLNGVVILAAVFVSWNITHRTKDFFVLLFLLVSGVYGVFVSQDLFFFFFWYEVAVLPMYLLIAVWGSSSHFGTFTRTKEYGAMKLTMMLVAGSVLIFIGIFALFVEAGAGTFDMTEIRRVGEEGGIDEDFQKWCFPLFMVGFGVLAGMWPLHTWSPDGHVAAPTGVSMLHAGVLMKLGAFGILRVGIMLLPEGADFWAPVLMTLGVTGALYGAVSALTQTDLKYMVGYSSVSHMGYVLMGLASMNEIGVNGAVLQMFAHGVMTALMFTNVGAVYDQAHIRDMTQFGGLAKQMPRHSAFFTIAGLSSLGLPGLAGFVAEFHIFVGVFKAGYWWAGGLGILAAAITATYILRMLARAYFGPANEKWADLKEMRIGEQFSAALLIAMILFMGLWPMPFIDRISQTVETIPGIN
ncbi:MAG TPA: NADH-quinone oxidoreductase subunit M [Dehalococcoidia bacterium]|nr:NADH-quinone oxidoreductase subunit M [Dehalococcoidia bacterium]